MTRIALTGFFISIELLWTFIHTLDCFIQFNFVILAAFTIFSSRPSTSFAYAVALVAGLGGPIWVEIIRALFYAKTIFLIVDTLLTMNLK